MMRTTGRLRALYPDAVIGALSMRAVANAGCNPELERAKGEIEKDLRDRFAAAGKDALKNHPVLAAYREYYKRFGKTYHVALQLESVIWKGKSIPSVNCLVEAMFMAELKNMLLTAGHDLDAVAAPLEADAAVGTESFVTMRGDEQLLKENDMFIRDGTAIVSNIIYGPDKRTMITERTANVVYTVYAPPGVGAEAVRAHLHDIQRYVLLSCPSAATECLETA